MNISYITKGSASGPLTNSHIYPTSSTLACSAVLVQAIYDENKRLRAQSLLRIGFPATREMSGEMRSDRFPCRNYSFTLSAVRFARRFRVLEPVMPSPDLLRRLFNA